MARGRVKDRSRRTERFRSKVPGFPQFLEGGAYRYEGFLGEGGMGVVCLYRDVRLDRLVAVKRLREALAGNRELRRRLMQEARVLAGLRHPNIGGIHHLADHEGEDYLVLEYVAGRTLADMLEAGPLPLDVALRVGAELMRAIEAGHAAEVIHRDVKPGNVIVTPAGVVKLMDWGLARIEAPGRRTTMLDDEAPAAIDVPAPRARPVMGTAGYMAPEQARGEAIDARADVFALGCVLFECLAGSAAFPGASAEERNGGVLAREPDWQLVAHVPQSVVDQVRACLAKDRRDRPRDLGVLAAAFERARSGARDPGAIVPHNLALPCSSFIPRAGEMERLRAWLDRAAASRSAGSLLTLVGPGGSGKTRLATALARAIVDDVGAPERFPDGVWRVDLDAVAEPDLIGHAVARVLTSDARGGPPLEHSAPERLAADLAERRLLLVLDNCERLAAGCARLVDALRARCAGIVILATSQAPLGAEGETTHMVRGLGLPLAGTAPPPSEYEAGRLFLARAHQANADFAPDGAVSATDAAAIAAICRRLEGIPLAIELAAARVGALPVTVVERRLPEVLDPRRILDASIAANVELLAAEERRLLGRLTIFTGGWALEAAERVCADAGADRAIGESPIVELLGRLVTRSLVIYEIRGDRARYHLFETVRGYAAKRLLPPADDGPVRRRHVAFFARLAHEARRNVEGADQIAWLDRLEIERGNFGDAIAHAARIARPDLAARIARNLHRFWYIRGFFDEGRALLEQALAARGAKRDLLQHQLLNALGILDMGRRRFGEARAEYEAALAIARELGDRRREAALLTNLGANAERAGDPAEALVHHEQAIEAYRRIGDEGGVAMVQLNAARAQRVAVRLDAARALTEACLPHFRRAGDRHRIAGALQNLGEIDLLEGRPDAARDRLVEALGTRKEMRDAIGMWESLLWIAMCSGRAGRHEPAATLLGAAEQHGRRAMAEWQRAEAVDYAGARDELRATLGSAAFEAALSRGAAMSLDEAVSLALEA